MAVEFSVTITIKAGDEVLEEFTERLPEDRLSIALEDYDMPTFDEENYQNRLQGGVHDYVEHELLRALHRDVPRHVKVVLDLNQETRKRLQAMPAGYLQGVLAEAIDRDNRWHKKYQETLRELRDQPKPVVEAPIQPAAPIGEETSGPVN